jgi:AcrR family transcriptional regulator
MKRMSVPTATLSKKAPRRTQGERSEATRLKLIEATLSIVAESGYACATTSLIVETARVSRGAMLHHFPTKADLMVAAADHVYRQHVATYAAQVSRAGAPQARLDRLLDVAWSLHQSRDTMALIEIWMASRGDPELDAKFEAFQERTYDERSEGLRRLLPEAGMDAAAARAWIVLGSAALRGLAIEQAMGHDPRKLAPAVELFRRFQRATLAELTVRSDGKR